MREIKFRAWDGKQMIGDNFLEYLCVGADIIVQVLYRPTGRGDYEPKICRQLNNNEVRKMTVMQFTGLKDKNGKEIWEGDINMDDDNRRSEVVFYAGGFYFKYSRTEYKSIGSFAPFNYMVIGNIYENPELLK